MDAAEVVERLGPHTSITDLGFEWSGAAQPVRLEEKRRIVAGRGGVGGDFLVVQENSRDQGLEVLRKDGKVYARSRYGQFRQRLRDRGMAERVRSEVQGVMRDVDALFLGRVALAPKGTESLDGRSAWKYGVSLAPEAPTLASGHALPALVEPKGGRDASTLRRLRFHEERVPVSLQGEIWIDAETSVVLKANLDGRLRVPAEGAEGNSQLALRVRTALSGVGKDAQLAVPGGLPPRRGQAHGHRRRPGSLRHSARGRSGRGHGGRRPRFPRTSSPIGAPGWPPDPAPGQDGVTRSRSRPRVKDASGNLTEPEATRMMPEGCGFAASDMAFRSVPRG